MNDAPDELTNDLSSALALLAEEVPGSIAAEAEAATAKAQAASAKALVSHSEALIARLKLEIKKVRRELYGSRSERKARRRRTGGGDRSQGLGSPGLGAEASVTETVSRTSPARTGRYRGSDKLLLLRFGQVVEARRGNHGDAGGHPAAVKSDPDGAGEVLLPRMREDYPTASPLPCDAARLCRAKLAGNDPV